jgi:CubicO group peptidase (beta-lactamase class C family)
MLEVTVVKQRNFFKSTSKTGWCIGTLFLILAPCLASAQTKKAVEIDAFVRPLVKANQFSGVILASYKGNLIYEKAFGMAQAELGVPNHIDTRFAIASVTKPMTQAITIRLIEEGKLGLQDKLSKWLPDFPNGEQITVEMLIQHRSGIPHRGTKEVEESLRYTAADMVEKAKQVKLEFKPGEDEGYSSLGYSVLARVLELASGKNFSQLLQEYIFTPAGMKDSVDFNGEAILPRRAQEYFLEPSGIVHAPLKDYSFLVGAGSVFSTAADIFRFGESVLNGVYGAGVKQALIDKGEFFGGGVSNGFRCYAIIDSQKDFGYVVISNLHSGANDLIVRNLPNILQDKAVSPPQAPNFTVLQISSERLQEYVGAYKFDKFTNTIVRDRNQLISGDHKIFPIGNDRFFRFADYATLTFTRSADGTVKELVWEGVGFKGTGIRQ